MAVKYGVCSRLQNFLQRDGHRAAGAAGDHHGLVVVDEAGRRLHAGVGLGFGIGRAEHQFLAQEAALEQGGNLLDLGRSGIDLLGGQFVAVLLLGALSRIRAGQVDSQADENGIAFRAGGPGPQGFLVVGHRNPGGAGQQHAAGHAGGTGLQHRTALDLRLHGLSQSRVIFHWFVSC